MCISPEIFAPSLKRNTPPLGKGIDQSENWTIFYVLLGVDTLKETFSVKFETVIAFHFITSTRLMQCFERNVMSLW